MLPRIIGRTGSWERITASRSALFPTHERGMPLGFHFADRFLDSNPLLREARPDCSQLNNECVRRAYSDLEHSVGP